LVKWFSSDVIIKYKHNIIGINYDIAVKWGELDAISESSGNKIPVIDGILAATAIVENLYVVTRNEKDIKKSGCRIFNPWSL
jgi:toxin FitB